MAETQNINRFPLRGQKSRFCSNITRQENARLGLMFLEETSEHPYFCLFHQEETSIYPDMAAYHSIAVTLGQAGFLEELLDLIPSLRKGPRSTKYLLNLKNHGALSPDIIIFNAVWALRQDRDCAPFKSFSNILYIKFALRDFILYSSSC